MRFLPSEEQLAFAEAVDDIVEAHGGTAIARAWGNGDTGPGTTLWQQFAETGLMALCLSEDEGGLDGTPVDVISVFERLGYHGVPGPLLESIALLPSLVDADARTQIASGELIATAAVEGLAPFAVDADTAGVRYLIKDQQIFTGSASEHLDSIDPTRPLARLQPEGEGRALDEAVLARALDTTSLAAAAALLGAGERLLAESVEYAKVREQFGRKIGEYQALKHQLADVRIALSFARPLLQGAAISLGTDTGPRDVSAAKLTAADAANLAAKVGLQIHAGIGYTEEHDLGIWLRRVPALSQVWGTPDMHRARVAQAILG